MFRVQSGCSVAGSHGKGPRVLVFRISGVCSNPGSSQGQCRVLLLCLLESALCRLSEKLPISLRLTGDKLQVCDVLGLEGLMGSKRPLFIGLVGLFWGVELSAFRGTSAFEL